MCDTNEGMGSATSRDEETLRTVVQPIETPEERPEYDARVKVLLVGDTPFREKLALGHCYVDRLFGVRVPATVLDFTATLRNIDGLRVQVQLWGLRTFVFPPPRNAHGAVLSQGCGWGFGEIFEQWDRQKDCSNST